MKPLLVGESNPYGADPYFALYPRPEGCAGHRLCVKVMQLSEIDYIDRFDRVNLCHRDWRMKEARVSAKNLISERAPVWLNEQTPHVSIVLLGSKVCTAFDFKFTPFDWFDRLLHRFIILPHPSGLSRAWHEPGAFERARSVLMKAGVL